MKKKGSSLLECMVAVSLFTIIILGVYKISFDNNLRDNIKIKNEDINRVLNCIVQEIKYNYSIEQMYNLLKEDDIKKKYYDNLDLDLTSKDLLSISNGEEIKIKLLEKNDNNLKIEVSLDFNYNDINISKNKVFIKSEWMELIDEL